MQSDLREIPRVCWNCKWWELEKDVYPYDGSCHLQVVPWFGTAENYCAEFSLMPPQMAERERKYRTDFKYPPYQIRMDHRDRNESNHG